MAFEFVPQQTLANVLCCMCGCSIPPNPSNMCVPCLRARVDITEGIPKSVILHWCKGCGKYLAPPARWLPAELESRELLALCLRSLRGLNRVKLVDAGFIWTEPHSKRLKVKLRVQKEVFNGAILQQIFQVEYVVTNQYCDECHRLAAENTWNTAIQLRQKAGHKRTFYFLEQLILKYNVHQTATGIKEFPDGLDFYFTSKSNGVKLLEFLQSRVPIRYKQAQRLISTDEQNNSYKYKYTIGVEISPICRDDLVVLPKKLALHLGTISQLVLCTRVQSVIQFIDPLTCQTADLHDYWRAPFRSLAAQDQLVQFVVIDIEPTGVENAKFALAEATVARVSDFGTNDITFVTMTHLGNLLQVGDYALGYDIENSNYNDPNWDALPRGDLPDVVLVRKAYPARAKKHRARHWKLQELAKVKHVEELASTKRAARAERLEEEREASERERFMQDLEENPALRAEINLYKADNFDEAVAARQARAEARARGEPVSDDDENDDELPDVGMDELLDDVAAMALDDGDAGPDDDGAAAADGAGELAIVDAAADEMQLDVDLDAVAEQAHARELALFEGGGGASSDAIVLAGDDDNDDAFALVLSPAGSSADVGVASAKPKAAKRAGKRAARGAGSKALVATRRQNNDDIEFDD